MDVMDILYLSLGLKGLDTFLGPKSVVARSAGIVFVVVFNLSAFVLRRYVWGAEAPAENAPPNGDATAAPAAPAATPALPAPAAPAGGDGLRRVVIEWTTQKTIAAALAA